MIRFSFLQGFNQGLRNMLNLQGQLYNTQNQISTGKRLNTPADDPVASARILQINQDQSRLGQYISNADGVENRLSLEEVQLSSVSNLLVRTRELTIQAGNSSMTQTDREALAAEVSVRLDELFDLANTRDSNGEYIFGGFQGNQRPFEVDQTGQYNYLGDDGQRLVQVASTTYIPVSDSGKAIFVEVDAAQNGFYTVNNPVNTGSGVAVRSNIDQTNFDAVYPNDYLLTYNAGTTSYDVTLKGDPTVITSVPAVGTPAVVDLTASLGFEVTISGTPNDGDTFLVESTKKQSIMQTLSNLAEGLNSLTDAPGDVATLEQLVANTLDNLSLAEDHISTLKAEIGARQNALDSVRQIHEGIELVNSQVLSEIRDLDYAEALSRLSSETFLLEASQQSFSRISNLSLFNFL